MITSAHVEKLQAQGKIFYKTQYGDISWEHSEGHITVFFENFSISIVYENIEELNNTLNACLTERYKNMLAQALSVI